MNNRLIVEDDVNINNMVKEALENNGFVCTQAYSGTEAKLLMKMNTFNLIVLDLMLPGVSGEEVLQEVYYYKWRYIRIYEN